ncbi:MAG TPA: hypothetical protein EYQ50_13850 [Verrucomicrobiales bacterium]|nr:hypothetical protein [Verrucomicrobiales bacterium]
MFGIAGRHNQIVLQGGRPDEDVLGSDRLAVLLQLINWSMMLAAAAVICISLNPRFRRLWEI